MSSSSSSSSSSRSSSRSSSSSCGPLDEAPSGLEAVNLSRKQREAWRKMSEHEERLQQVDSHHGLLMRLRWERKNELEISQRLLQDAQRDLTAAKKKPRADAIPPLAGEPPAFQDGQIVSLKPKWWKQLKLPTGTSNLSCHWRVSHYNDTSCTYTLATPVAGHVISGVPAAALEELEFHLEPGLVVSISEPPALPEHLLQQLRRSGGGNGVLKQRRSDTTFEVAFNRTVLPIPNINLRSNSLHQPRVPRRVAASVLPGTPLLGDFGHLDYVRDPEGRRGVVTGRCPENSSNLTVIFTSYGTKSSIPATALTPEHAWFAQRVTEMTEVTAKSEEEWQKSCAEVAEEETKLQRLREEQEKLTKQHDDAVAATRKVAAKACSLRLVKLVCFKTEDRPKVWREMSSYVTVDWTVVMESESEGHQLPLQQFKAIAREAIREDLDEHIFVPSQLPPFRLSRDLAKKMLTRRIPDPLSSIALLKAAFGAEDIMLDQDVQDFFNGPVGLIHPADVAPPTALAKVLRPYQVTGFRWLLNNARNGLGCLLADDMGLGKTLQTISFIMHLKQEHLLKPMLIVVPTGLLQTWRRELEHWAKNLLHLQLFHGKGRQLPSSLTESVDGSPKRRRMSYKQPERKMVDVVLTSYGVLRSDAKKLALPVFGGMILDEAQTIKNFNTQLSKAVKEVTAVVGDIRVALTGTPVENGLTDLYSLFDFILPGYLSSSKSAFEKKFAQPLKLAVRKNQMRKEIDDIKTLLNRMKEPFVLRRLKAEVVPELPEKVEQTHEKLYSLVEKRQSLACNTTFGGGRNFQALQMLQAMREVCNHPVSLAKDRRPEGYTATTATDIELSGKCAKFHELLDTILAAGEKVLVFSSSLSAIDVLMQQIEKRKDKPQAMKIIGAVPQMEREVRIEKFQSDPSYSILLLSQVGNVGLTLTAATNVIHFDRQYNPAKENQATDRAHRIGQEHTVFVHYLVSKDTFEERLAQILKEKQELSDCVIGFDCERFITDMNNGELHEFFSLKS